MQRVDVYTQLDAAPLDAVRALVHHVQEITGQRPLSDQLWLDLARGDHNGAAGVVTHQGSRLTGYCQISSGNHSWVIGVVVAPESGDEELDTTNNLVRAACSLIASRGGGEVNWWVDGPGAIIETVAARHGFHVGRALHQMRVPLPLAGADVDPAVSVRPFRVGDDEDDWLEVNNAAFQSHPEQGRWDLDTLRQREREEWFDPDGFLLHHQDHRLAGFCWTKIHRDSQPVLGEIYVIAVHPEFHGRGLGRALTVAGLAHLAGQGVSTGMLYVDGDNTAAFHLYQRLGFAVYRTDRVYVSTVSAIAELPRTTSTAAHPA